MTIIRTVIRKTVLESITPAQRTRIAAKIGGDSHAFANHLRANKPDGRATKYSALKAISEITGLPIEDVVEVTEECT